MRDNPQTAPLRWASPALFFLLTVLTTFAAGVINAGEASRPLLEEIVARAQGDPLPVGVFPPQDPNGSDRLMQEGKIAFDFGTFFTKGQRMGTGQCDVKRYNRQLRDLIAADKIAPSIIVSHQVGLDEAPEAYKHFDAREDGWIKVVLHP